MPKKIQTWHWRNPTKAVVAGFAAVGIVRLVQTGPLWTQDPLILIGIIIVAVVLSAE